MRSGHRVVVIGAGVVGTACAYFLARDGHDVTLVDRGAVAGGTTSRGEGNILVSDKEPGPELDLALWSGELWRGIGRDLGDDALERESKGGVVVATSEAGLAALTEFAGRQAAAGVRCEEVPAGTLHDYEPHLAPGLPGGMYYPDDQQVQPALAAAQMMRAARALGATVLLNHDVVGMRAAPSGAVSAVECRSPTGTGTAMRVLPADVVVNAAGTWGGEVAALLGAPIPVLPRRGFILVTEPLPRIIRHKVYTADYVDNVASGDEGLETSVVVEGTRGGTVLIGASRERVGFDARIRFDVVRTMARAAVSLFPVLAGVNLMRVYRGFRPYCPDHLPIIGPDPRRPGVWHACGHEGAGIGLAPATGALIADLLGGRTLAVPAAPFSATRFDASTHTSGHSTGEKAAP
jgi:glycine/D-amino acid oxidase-like deaminating enzyme